MSLNIEISLTRNAIESATRDVIWDATDSIIDIAAWDAIDDATRIAIGTQHIITDSIWDILKEAIDGLGY